MQFKSLRIANFGSIKEVEIPLCDQGLTLLVGRNEDAPKADSNGSGKSLPLDAFTWALWGSTIRGFSTDDVIHNKVNKDCKVQLFLEEGNHSYEIRRYRRNKADKKYKANDLVLLCDGEDVSGSSISETEDIIRDIVGLDFSTFCAMMPGSGVSVATMTDSEVKSLLEKLLRTEVLKKAADEARRRYKFVSDTILTSSVHLKDLNSSIKDIEERLVSLKDQESSFVKDSKQKIAEIDKELAVVYQKSVRLGSIIDYEPVLDEKLKDSEDLVSLLHEDMRDLNEAFSNKEGKYKYTRAQEETFLSLEQDRLDDSRESLSSLQHSNNTCPVCLQGVDESVQHNIKDYQTQREEEIKLRKDKMSKLTDTFLKDMDVYKKAKDKLSHRISKEEKILKELKNSKSETDIARANLVGVSNSIRLLEKNKHDLKFIHNPYTSMVAEEEKRLSHKVKERDQVEDHTNKLQKRADILKFWVDSFSPSGIRSFMLENVTPILNHYAKFYSDIVTDGEMSITFDTKETLKNGKVAEKFNIKVEQKNGGTSYLSNSSGERARANLVIALALGELASLRAEKAIPFRFLDEPFESIDESGIEAIVNLLNQQKDKYNTVYVITHQDQLKQMFQNRLTMVKKDGFSQLEN